MERSNKFRNIMKNKVIFSSKKEVAIVIDDIETTFLDEMMLRFPHIVQDVFKELDNKSLTNCRNVSRACCDFIDDEKLYWVRKIQNYVSMKNFLIQWQKVLRNTPIENIKKIFVIVKEFIENNLNLKKQQLSPLHVVGAQGHLEFCKFIIEKTKVPNPKRRKDGITAFHLAAHNGCQEICELMIENLEDKNPADNYGMTPFHSASEKGHFGVCKILIQNIDNKNPAALNGCTPLHLATKNGHLEIVRLIVQNIDDKNPATRDGCTPLHLATHHGHLEIVRLIVETGVDKSPLFNGKTPLDLVRPRSRYSFYKLLIDNNSQIWRQIGNDILATLCILVMLYLIALFWTLLFLYFCVLCNNCPVYLVTLSICLFVPSTIYILLVAMIWVYLSGWIDKYTNQYDSSLFGALISKFYKLIH